jgi:hypothetical protein
VRLYCCLSVIILLGLTFGAHAEEAKSDSADRWDSAKQKDADCKDCLTRGYGIGMPCACLQALAVDLPGPFDLYYCHAHYTDSCEDPYEEENWFGKPTNPNLPQICNGANESGACESLYNFYRQHGGETFPGHGSNLTADYAWDLVRSGLRAAQSKSPKLRYASAPEYHIIPKGSVPKSLGATDDMLVMAAEVTLHFEGSPADGKKIYLCFQLDSAKGEEITPIKEITESKHFFGQKFRIKYKVGSEDEPRTGFVWVK